MTMFCVVVVYLQDSSCSRALRFYSARAVPQEIYEMPSLTERSHKASLERLLVQFSYSWQREYYNKRYHLTKKSECATVLRSAKLKDITGNMDTASDARNRQQAVCNTVLEQYAKQDNKVIIVRIEL